ncbi:MAG TPA: T9SS type A sorting domain-containing protein, partial [Chitinophagales bacterium]|nr:T9SS type A sorting domain-containing protein [Chitinophagales bacterium]
ISGGPPSGNKTSTGCGYEDYWVVKIDSNGNELWDKDYGGLNGDDLRSVVQTKDKGYLIAGYSNSVPSCDKSEINLSLFQTWVVKVDSLGNKEWDKTIFTIGSGELDGYAIETCDGCYVIANGTRAGIGGYKTQPNWDLSDATYDVWLVKFCFTGTPEGINQLSQQARIKVFPAPFTQDLNVNIQQPGLKQATISICNILGQAVYTNTETNLSPNYTKMLDLRYLPNGIYFVKVEVDGAVEVKEVVKE